jgi:hypothetical protein
MATPDRNSPKPRRQGSAVALGALLCEIDVTSRAEAKALAKIAQVCAHDVGLAVHVRTRRAPKRRTAPAEKLITLHLPAELPASQHPVWCLACRLACFCPNARVSVLVSSRNLFSHASLPARVGKSA